MLRTAADTAIYRTSVDEPISPRRGARIVFSCSLLPEGLGRKPEELEYAFMPFLYDEGCGRTLRERNNPHLE
jgi:hypothetical protein